MRQLEASDVRSHWLTGREIALIDLREEAFFAGGHPLFAASLPLSRIELEVLDRIPRVDAPIVLYDDGDGLVEQAQARLAGLGYRDVSALRDGLAGWRAAGLELFEDVNSASKAFGELVEARRHTPSISPEDLRRRIAAGDKIAILDARRLDEYATMTIPTSISVPGAELVLRAEAIAPDRDTCLVVNCAGRTRSIIGAQSLINAGLDGRVMALRNGTIGWTLADLELEQGADRRFPPSKAEALAPGRARARAVAYRAGVRHIRPADLTALAADRSRTLYRFDVRTPDEYEAGHLPDFRGVPGGQLVQETDVFAPVRGARIVLHDPLGARADMSASWLAQMGWDVMVLDAPLDDHVLSGPWRPRQAPPPAHAWIDADTLAKRLVTGDVTVIDLGPSADRRAGHIPGSLFAIRSMLPAALANLRDDRAIILSSPDGTLARYAAPEVERLCGRPPAVLAGGLRAWREAGLPLATGLGECLSDPVDRYKRPYEGTDNSRAAMQAYLDWEYGLVAQLERDASHGFFVI